MSDAPPPDDQPPRPPPPGEQPPRPPAPPPAPPPMGQGAPWSASPPATYHYGTGTPRQPNNYLPWAILSTLFCCLPFGIVAIVKAAQVSSLWGSGRFDEAQRASDQARKWIVVAVCAAAVPVVAMIALTAIGSTVDSGGP